MQVRPSHGVKSLDEHGDRITKLLDLKVPEGLLGKLSLLPRLMEVAKFPPRMKSGTPSCQEIVWRGDDIDLRKIPVLTTWPDDGGPFITPKRRGVTPFDTDGLKVKSHYEASMGEGIGKKMLSPRI